MRKIEHKIRVVLVIFKADIKPRAVLLNEIAFHEQRFKFRLSHSELELADPFHQDPSFWRELFWGLKIGSDAVFEILRFADIEDAFMFIAHHVDTRLSGPMSDLLRKRLHGSATIPGFLVLQREGLR